ENPYLCSSGDRSRRRALPPEHASDDSWCDDGLLNEISDADLNREQKRRYDQ
ncbi:unnamed protein product, partial [Musa hybrid cultivar]